MASTKAGFHVLLDDPMVLTTRTPEVAKVLAKALGETKNDVALRVRYGGGIVARDLPDEALAKAIVGELGAVGLGAFVVPVAAIEPMPRPRRLASLTATPEGLEGHMRGGTKRESLPWSRVRALHVYALARELSPEELAQGRTPRPTINFQSLSKEVRQLISELDFWDDREKTRRIDLGIDIIAEGPVYIGRINAEDADYSKLEKKSESALENFLQLVAWLLKLTPPAVVVPPSTRRFAEKTDWKPLLFEKPEQRDSFTQWIVLAVTHGNPFGVEVPFDEPGDDETHDDEDDDADDADADEGDEDDEEGEEDEEEEEPTAEALAAEALTAAGGDAELAKTLQLFDKTRRLRKSDVEDALKKAAATPDARPLEADAKPSAEVTGRWDISKVLEETKDLDDKDLG
jgi:hypothetical protein